ncbi:class C sortase [Peptoniphilus indolicus]|uniref:Sortase (Surface protein transpeptidase) n=1 Tax=Peptoniphilus indolicus TaxID=33030 RepID=A0A379DCZ8_9FIRM|nr:class C sortase [Peptoniphilus indolicus]SUB75143.1 Sortase (surface protein transpeptidase) [Peptoniphilus indolicus]
MGIRKSTIVVSIVILAGIVLLLYPTVSNWWNAKHQSIAIESYVSKVEKSDETEYIDILKEARKYNESLVDKSLDRLRLSKKELDKYNSMLKIEDSEIISVISIPKINLRLPIYHGTDEAVLQVAIGHIPGTSLPVGGKDTHSVISGHTGLTSAKLFTDIEKLLNGDTFTLNTLNETLIYEVDQVRVVLPQEVDDLNIDKGKDYVTLQTCTPYGVNTHRLLVRGSRINTDLSNIKVTADAIELNSIVINIVCLIILILIFYIVKFIMILVELLLSKR